MASRLEIRIGGDNAVRAGETIKGTVRVEPGESADSGSVTLEWEGPSPASSLSPVLLHDGPIPAGAPLELPFRLTAPAGPPSYEGEVLDIRHTLRARLERPGFDARTEASVKLEGGETGLPPLPTGSPVDVRDRIGMWVRPRAGFVPVLGGLALVAGLLTLFMDGPGTAVYVALGLGGFLLGWQWLRAAPGRSLGMIRLRATSRVVRPGDSLQVSTQAGGDGGVDRVVARIVCHERRRPIRSTHQTRPTERRVEDAPFQLRREGRGRWAGVVVVPGSHRPSLRATFPDSGLKAGANVEVEWSLSLEFYRGNRLLGQLQEPLFMPAEAGTTAAPPSQKSALPSAEARPLPSSSDPERVHRFRRRAAVAVVALGLVWALWPRPAPGPRFRPVQGGVGLAADGVSYRSSYLHDQRDPEGERAYVPADLAPFAFAVEEELARARTRGVPLEDSVPNLGRRVRDFDSEHVVSWCWTVSPGGSGFIGCFGLYARVDEAMALDFDRLPGRPVDVRWIDDTSALVVYETEDGAFGALVARLDGRRIWETPPPPGRKTWTRPVVYAPTDAPIVVLSWGLSANRIEEPVPTYVIDRASPDRVQRYDLDDFASVERPLEGQDRAAYLSPPWDGGPFETRNLWFSLDQHPLLGEGGLLWREPIPLADPDVPPYTPRNAEEIYPTEDGDESIRATVTAEPAGDEWFVVVDPQIPGQRARRLRLNHRYSVTVESDERSWTAEFTREEAHKAGLDLWDGAEPYAPHPRLARTDPALAVLSGLVVSYGEGGDTQYFMVDGEGTILGQGHIECRGQSPVGFGLVGLAGVASPERFLLTCETLFDVEVGPVRLPGGSPRLTAWIGDRILKLDTRDVSGPNAYIVRTDGTVETRFRYDGWDRSGLDFGEIAGVVQDPTSGRVVLPQSGPCEGPGSVYVIDRDASLYRLERSDGTPPAAGPSVVRWTQERSVGCSDPGVPASYVGDLSAGVFTEIPGTAGGPG